MSLYSAVNIFSLGDDTFPFFFFFFDTFPFAPKLLGHLRSCSNMHIFKATAAYNEQIAVEIFENKDI